MVELVIKIPEDVYTRLFDNGIQDNEIATDDICEMARALRMGKPLSEELEKIKHEIGEEFVDLQDGSEEWRSYVNDAVLSCYEILEKHISELKGEQE